MNRLATAFSLAALTAVLASVLGTPTAAQGRRIETGFALKHDVSAPLAALAKRAPRTDAVDKEVRINVPSRLPDRPKPVDAGADRLRQHAPGDVGTPAPLLSFEGISDDDNASVVGFRVVPPDTQGDVGRDQYVQWVNLLMAVYDKKTGARWYTQEYYANSGFFDFKTRIGSFRLPGC